MLFVSDSQKITEDPVYRIVVTNDSVQTTYPLDGGYYTLGINHRVQDRLWYGSLVNPASTSWANIIKGIMSDMQSRGFTGIFFDTWAPDYPEQFTNEAPSIEFNPGGVMTNQYAQALHKLGPILKSAFPGMTIIANTVQQIGDVAKEVDWIKIIDGGMSESCIIYDGTRLTGQKLKIQMDEIEQILGLNKNVLCFPKYQQNRWARTIEISPFDPVTRIYGLAAALSMSVQPGGKGKLYYGPRRVVQFTTLRMV